MLNWDDAHAGGNDATSEAGSCSRFAPVQGADLMHLFQSGPGWLTQQLMTARAKAFGKHGDVQPQRRGRTLGPSAALRG